MPDYLRRATPDDAPGIRALALAAYAKWIPILGREPKPMKADYDQIVHKHIVDLLFVDDSLTAFIEMVVEPDCVLIENVAVRPDRFGRGYGRTMMAHAEELARSMGRTRLRLHTNKLMAKNIALYQRLGYGIDREETTADGRQMIHMSMSI
jgi:GNAT superfamily N-acetyltransferase